MYHIVGGSPLYCFLYYLLAAQLHIIVLLESPPGKIYTILTKKHIPYSITTNYQKLIFLVPPRDNTARQSPAFATSRDLSKISLYFKNETQYKCHS
ncbi:hypothetical protein CFP56_033273 [Quercus suber]|uniref:Secreted protein n=1 Tax=Quercus suber TaxID=58331 RepID=A0AAW0MB14_QUESU